MPELKTASICLVEGGLAKGGLLLATMCHRDGERVFPLTLSEGDDWDTSHCCVVLTVDEATLLRDALSRALSVEQSDLAAVPPDEVGGVLYPLPAAA